jgi:lysophospholipase L1-like esterase
MLRTRQWIAAGGLAIVAALLVASSLARQGSHGALYLGLGDSLAEGVGASGPNSGFVERFFDHVRSQGPAERLVFANRAIGGETSGSFLRGGQLDGALGIINDPDIDTPTIVLSIGGNDLLGLLAVDPCASNPAGAACRDAVATNLAAFAVNYAETLARLRNALDARSGQGTLIVITLYNPFSGTGSVFEAPTDLALLGEDLAIDCDAVAVSSPNVGLNDLLTCLGQSVGATVADIYPAFLGRGVQLTHIATGDHHPNDAGHAAIADAIIAVGRTDSQRPAPA